MAALEALGRAAIAVIAAARVAVKEAAVVAVPVASVPPVLAVDLTAIPEAPQQPRGMGRLRKVWVRLASVALAEQAQAAIVEATMQARAAVVAVAVRAV
ncbi:MAG: hypothetical protein M9944_13040 [Rhizobiaceae bacterium]|nr:hypothetical protein [Rhizobiaceae bacterium]